MWSADNCFTGGEMAAHKSPVLVMADTETSVVFAHACKRKGADPSILETPVKDIEVLDHRQIVFKSHQENPVRAVQKELAARRPEVKVQPKAPFGSKWYGGRVIGLIRVLKDALEANIKQAIEPNTPVVTFMVNHAGTIINRFSVDKDCKTPMDKARGTAAN